VAKGGVFVYGKILVPLDGSKLAEGVLPHVQELARRFDSEVTLIQVVAPLSRLVAEAVPASLETTGAAAAVGLEAAAEAVKAEHEGARSYLESVAERWKAEKMKVQIEVAEGTAGDAIVDYAHHHGMDLIAMSTHGRSGLLRLVYGSVADHVLRHAGTPVLLIRSRQAGG
jgi:nucleotide-binding universal stress UspA family protein